MTFKELPMRTTFRWAGEGKERGGTFLKVSTHHATDLTTHKLKRFEGDTPVEKGKT